MRRGCEEEVWEARVRDDADGPHVDARVVRLMPVLALADELGRHVREGAQPLEHVLLAGAHLPYVEGARAMGGRCSGHMREGRTSHAKPKSMSLSSASSRSSSKMKLSSLMSRWITPSEWQ